LNKRYLSYFATILFVLLIIAPGIAAADKCTYTTQCTHTTQCTYTTVNICDAKQMVENKDVFLLDVRIPTEYDSGHIEGATLIPLRNIKLPNPQLPDEELLPARMKELPHNKNAKILVYCKLGGRSAEASNLLVKAGYKNVYNMDNDADSTNENGGISQWVSEENPIVATYDSWTNEWCKLLPPE